MLVNDDSVCPVGYLHPTKVSIVQKNLSGQEKVAHPCDGRVINVPYDWAAPVETNVERSQRSCGPAPTVSAALTLPEVSAAHVAAYQNVRISPGAPPPLFSMHAHAAFDDSEQGTEAGVAACLQGISERLRTEGLPWSAVLLVHLALSDLSHFTAANAAYCRVVPQVTPPARLCVQLPETRDHAVCAVDALVARGEAAKGRLCLHVQSVSDWAPACIGPYAQATVAGGLLSMAGQIPLHPATMMVSLQPINPENRMLALRCEEARSAGNHKSQRFTALMSVTNPPESISAQALRCCD